MGLLDKLKNVFFEEEEVEVEEKPKKEKPKKEKPLIKKIETPKKEPKVEKTFEDPYKEEDPTIVEKDEDKEIELLEDFEEPETFKRSSDRDFKFPVILDEEEETYEEETPVEEPIEEYKEVKWDNHIYGDAKANVESSYENERHKEPYANSYTRDFNASSYSLNQPKKEEKVFRPSPVISPVYGVLDLNYTKDEIKEKNKVEREPVFSFSETKLDLDDVRAKAFGLSSEVPSDVASEIEDDIEENDIDIGLDMEEPNETIDMTDTNMKPVVDSVTVGDAEEYFEDLGLEYNVDYKDSKKKKKAKKNREDDIEEDADIEEIGEPIITDKPKRKRAKEEEENDIDVDIEDNLFDLIDSMYDEGE